MKITANFNEITGKIRPMHGVGQPPFDMNLNHMHYLSEAGIPYSRLHDVSGAFGGSRYVDIPNVFPDFDADETKEESYDFTFTDRLMAALMDNGCEPFYRLGVTIENFHTVKAYRIFPPKDYEKWARICEHIVRHYNEGWANGFHYNIKYWEIWNEPDDCYIPHEASMWHGTDEEYFRLYDVASKHLKKCFGDTIKVGGYAGCGFYGRLLQPDLTIDNVPDKIEHFHIGYMLFFKRFLEYITANGCPIDFFSWHSYESVETTGEWADYCHSVLVRFGLEVEEILNEWNPTISEDRDKPIAAARALAMMLQMQKKGMAMLNFYDARATASTYAGLFNSETKTPRLTYHAFTLFNQLYKLGSEVETACDNKKIYVGAATDGQRKVLAIANLNDEATEIELDIIGADFADTEVFVIDKARAYSRKENAIKNGKITLAAASCTEIRFN